MKNVLKGSIFYVIIAIIVVLGINYIRGNLVENTGVTYSQFQKYVAQNKVSGVEVRQNSQGVTGELTLHLKDGEYRTLDVSDVTKAEDLLDQKNISYKVTVEKESVFMTTVLPMLLICVIFMVFFTMGSRQATGGNARMMNFGKSRATLTMPDNSKVTFKDVAGLQEEKEELEEQRKRTFSYQPLFSVVVPLYRTKPEFLKEMIGSIQAQTYGNWQLCLADGSLSGDDAGTAENGQAPVTELTPLLEQYAKADKRITFTTLPKNLGISGNTNAALALAAGDYIVLADHDDIVPANALYVLADALNQDRSIDVLYSDEDKIILNRILISIFCAVSIISVTCLRLKKSLWIWQVDFAVNMTGHRILILS